MKVLAKVAKVLWFGAALFILFVLLYGFDGKSNSDITIFEVYMLCLSFPAGLMVPLVYIVLYDVLSITLFTTYLSIVIDWTGFLVLGYLQWFKLLPYLIGKIRNRIDIKSQLKNV